MSLQDMLAASGSNRVVTTRGELWRHVLSAARTGTLTPDWRDSLTVDAVGIAPPLDGSRVVDDADALALHEVVTSPAADWEPYAANGDWRRALTAWYTDYLNAFDTQVNAMQSHLNDFIAAGGTQNLGQYAKDLLEGRSTTLINHCLLQMHRNDIGAQYRAGLAAGGDDVDWLGWLEERTAALDPGDVPDRIASKQETLEALRDRDAARKQLNWEFLPHYWTTQAPTNTQQ